jgi:hypothetical protein
MGYAHLEERKKTDSRGNVTELSQDSRQAS